MEIPLRVYWLPLTLLAIALVVASKILDYYAIDAIYGVVGGFLVGFVACFYLLKHSYLRHVEIVRKLQEREP